ncbi:serine hydrolase [Brachybacterium ginsengisoli]|uniref:Serine hydrolase n=1 Tax=Brachybacterium ginsengisoli TaxID=1331682 RepID=A0A291H0T3_9MICO|nr:serine hydrolase [Brachybacterium ginsengisoli]ATG55974.1 serine hydrolase [Brachybacterium ginsengisoli]
MTLPTAAAPDQVSVSHCLLDAQGRVLSAHGADRPYYAASTIKLHVLLAALEAAEEGRIDLAASVPATRTFLGADGVPFTLGGDHLDPTHPAEGAGIEVAELLRRMIDRSSNEATDHVIELVGLDAVAEMIAQLGLRSTRVERLIGDASALAAGATNETGAADLAATLLAAVRGAGSGDAGEGATEGAAPLVPATPLLPASRTLALSALRAQQIPVIATALRPGVDHGSKSGWVDGYRHDVAFVGDPDGPGLRVLAVMTAGLEPSAADARITGLVRDLLPEVSV